MFTFIFGVFSRSISTKQHTFFSLSAPKDTEKMTHSMLVSGGVGCVSVIVESKENFFCLMLDVTYQIMNTQYFAQFNLNINLQVCASFSLLLILLGGSGSVASGHPARVYYSGAALCVHILCGPGISCSLIPVQPWSREHRHTGGHRLGIRKQDVSEP